MRIVKNNQGYTMVLSLAIIFIFAILGMSLYTLSINGIVKNETRQNTVRSQDLSEKGLDFFVKNIENELITYLGNSGKPRSSFATELEKTLDKYKCDKPNSKLTNTSTGNATYCIVGYSNVIEVSGKENDLRKLVTLKSTGTSGNIDTTITTNIEIGADSFPDELNYAIGTNLEGTKENGKGNLYIHGGAEIKGDIKVEGDLLTSNQGYGLGKWIPSVLPRMLPFNQNAEKANIVLKGERYLIKNNPTYSDHIKRSSNYSSTNYTKKTNINDLFETGYSPRVVERNPLETKINIPDQKTNFYFNKSSPGISEYINDTTTLNNVNIDNASKKTILVYRAKEWQCGWWSGCSYEYGDRQYNKNYTLSGNNSFYSLSTEGDLSIKQDNSSLNLKRVGTDQYGTMYSKNFNIGNMYESNDTSNAPNISIEGTYYVDGDLTIKGANLKTNAVMYVDGDVLIRFSTINGKDLGQGKKGSLVIFATGNIDISNNSVNSAPENPSIITGFFYSEGNFEMYGVGSNMTINGGISANRIILNAIRGRAISQSSSNSWFEPEASQKTTYANYARLKVHYNPDIITTYSDLRQKEPIIYYIDESIVKTRNFK